MRTRSSINLRRGVKAWARNALPATIYTRALFEYHRFRGTLEPELFFIKNFARRSRTAIDVGAYNGLFLLYLARIFRLVYAFEPVEELYQILSRLRLRNARVFNVAVSGTNKDLLLRIPMDGSHARYTEASLVDRAAADDAEIKTVSVSCRTLDSFNITDCDFMKIDVEGHELDVLKGGLKTIERSLPVLLVEIEQRWQKENKPISETFGFLKHMGYRGYFIRDKKIWPLSAFDVQRDQLDILHPTRKSTDQKSAYINNFFFCRDVL